MYKIFVVEDEPLIRQSIRTAVETSDGPYAFCGEAADGEMALSMMIDLAPDILITDIKMPFMDGLELARLAKEALPWLKVLIISGHDEFGYAQQAIAIGVDQYLLKPIRQKELIAAVDTAVRGIEEEKKRRSISDVYDERKVQAALFRQLMHHLLFGDAGTAQILDDAKTLGVNLRHSLHRVVVVQTFGADPASENFRTVRDILLGRFGRDIRAAGIFVVPDQLAAVVSADDPDELTEEVYNVLRIVLHDLEVGGISAAAVASDCVDRLSSVSDAYTRASVLLRTAGHLYAGQILDLADPSQMPENEDNGAGIFEAKYRKKIQYAGTEDAKGILDEYLAEIGESVLESSVGRYQILRETVNSCARIVSEANTNTPRREAAAGLASIVELVDASQSRDSFYEMALNILKRTVLARQSSVDVSKRSSVIRQAVEFIEENYANPDISLHMVAAHAGFSPAHFSMVFSQKMGRTFTDYLTGVRIEKAKELLSGTDSKLSKIAMEVGYNEPNYFSFVFKKREGISPKEFRSRMKK